VTAGLVAGGAAFQAPLATSPRLGGLIRSWIAPVGRRIPVNGRPDRGTSGRAA